MSWLSDNTMADKIGSTMLTPAANIYGLLSDLHAQAYKMKLLNTHKMSVPIISIGNLTVGGTGKTPVTIDIAQRLTQQGMRVAILSRGYKRLSNEQVVIVSNGKQLFADAKEAGDEPYMMALASPSSVVISGKNRVATAEIAINLYDCNVILLDDGFQRLPLRRNEDIVLLDYNYSLNKQKLLPAGCLREPLKALARATSIVVTKVPHTFDEYKLNQFRDIANKYAPEAGFTSCQFIADKLIDNTGYNYDLDYLQGKRVFAFCGLANPVYFYNQLKQLGATIVNTLSFADHHWYSSKDLQIIETEFLSAKADMLITTEKDFVRIDTQSMNSTLAFLKISTQWLGPIPNLTSINKEACKILK